jgi:hypothetical protein
MVACSADCAKMYVPDEARQSLLVALQRSNETICGGSRGRERHRECDLSCTRNFFFGSHTSSSSNIASCLSRSW